MEAATIPNDDSARILAAAGWQSDPRRLPVLRDLLGEHLRRIYFYSYEESRNRAAAIDCTRGTLMRVARTMESIPAGCPLVTWVFLTLEGARVPADGNPDFWRLLVIAEAEWRAAAGAPAGAPAGMAAGASTSTASHPMLRPLVSLYRRFLDVRESGDVEPRANWPAAKADLDCFLRAQFAETGDTTHRTAPAWRRWLATRPWRRPRNIAAAAITVVVVPIAFVVGFTLVPPKGRRTTFPGSARPPVTDTTNASRSGGGADSTHSAHTAHTADNTDSDDDAVTPAPGQAPVSTNPASTSREPSTDCRIASAQAARGLLARGKASLRINGARCELITRDSLRFAWMPAQGVTEYRVCLITAKRDTLGVVPAISGTCVTVPVKGVPNMAVPGSFILRVDGLAGGQLIAVSDPQPFEIP